MTLKKLRNRLARNIRSSHAVKFVAAQRIARALVSRYGRGTPVSGEFATVSFAVAEAFAKGGVILSINEPWLVEGDPGYELEQELEALAAE